ncbi:hypothetical protein AB0C89_23535 [Streptomyces sp. NPDC048491]|uniref:hypothetical protein n=1 Tax=unclassified Streptomyces TaxID=2593676 RepID=UPI000C27793F|nr:hypothetical protein [Streptomyces sp. CB01201]MBX7467261.1 hypothetical protein [Streptomyces sp. MAG02]PJM98873.1 hypothetical protein CG740_32765 [Streptomyces sp. CB01201]
MDTERLTFDGWIAAVGTGSGTRVVVGHWPRSPFGAFSDVMVERADGWRLLLAPSEATAEYVSAVYHFDEVRRVAVKVEVRNAVWDVTAGPLDVQFAVGRRGVLGLALRAVPRPLARRPLWAALADGPARLMTGVRTRGSSRPGCRQWYAAGDLLPIVSARARFDGSDLGPLAPVSPPVRFGFASAPAAPSLVRVVSTVERTRSA